MKHFCCAFLPVLKTLLDAGIPEHKDMIDALQAMVGLVELFDSIGYFPTSKQYAKARDLEKRFFHHYSSLSQWADKNDRLLFHVVMKHHTCHHMIRDSCFLNPKFRRFCGKNQQVRCQCSNGSEKHQNVSNNCSQVPNIASHAIEQAWL